MQNRENNPTTIDIDTEFDSIAANYERHETLDDFAARLDEALSTPVYAGAALVDSEFDRIAALYDSTEAQEPDYAAPTPSTPAPSESRRTSKAEKTGWFSKLGSKVWMAQLGMQDSASERSERLKPNENDSRLKKFGKKALEYAIPSAFAGAILGGMGLAVYNLTAAKHGLDPITRPYTDGAPMPSPSGSHDPQSIFPAPKTGDVLAPNPNVVSPPTEALAPIRPRGGVEPHVIKTQIGTGAPIHDKIPTHAGGKPVVVLTGGATDPDAEYIKQQLIDNGTIDPNKVTIIQNHYPAEMAPFVGTHTTQESTAIGAQGLRDIIAQNPNADITSYEFSEGNFPADTVAAELAKAGNHNVHFVGYGSGNSASGLLNSKEAQMFRPIVDSLGIIQTPPAPGSTMILSGRDMYASTAGDGIGGLISKALGPDHRIVGPNEPRVMTFTLNGVNYEVVDQPVPLPPGAVLTSGEAAPGFGGLPQALIPGVNLPPDPNMPPAPDFVPDMNTLPPAPQDIVKTDAPSFFGEAPCVAPNGDQYFTPANAPC